MEPIPAPNRRATIGGHYQVSYPLPSPSFLRAMQELSPLPRWRLAYCWLRTSKKPTYLDSGAVRGVQAFSIIPTLSYNIASKFSTLHNVGNRDHRSAQASLSNTCDDLKKSSRNLTDGCVYTLPTMLMAIVMPNLLAELDSLLGSC